MNKTCLPIISNGFLTVQSQDGLKLNRVLQFWLVQSSQDWIWRHFAWWWSSIPRNVELLDIVFLSTYTDHIWESLYHFISSSCTEMLEDHVSNLSSSKESVVFLSTLLLRQILFCGSEDACREGCSLQTQSSHPAYWSRGDRFAPQSIAMSLVRQLILQSPLLWSRAYWSEDRLFLDKLQFWRRLSSCEIP